MTADPGRPKRVLPPVYVFMAGLLMNVLLRAEEAMLEKTFGAR